MNHNPFESKQLSQINEVDRINEGLGIGKLILRLLFGSKFKKELEKIADNADDYPEYESALINLRTTLDTFPDLIKRGDDALKRIDARQQQLNKRLSKLQAMKR